MQDLKEEGNQETQCSFLKSKTVGLCTLESLREIKKGKEMNIGLMKYAFAKILSMELWLHHNILNNTVYLLP